MCRRAGVARTGGLVARARGRRKPTMLSVAAAAEVALRRAMVSPGRSRRACLRAPQTQARQSRGPRPRAHKGARAAALSLGVGVAAPAAADGGAGIVAAGVEDVRTVPVQPYTPSEMDLSLLAPQLLVLAIVTISVAYLQVFVTGTARARFDKADPQRRAFVEESEASEDSDGAVKDAAGAADAATTAGGWVERELARKGGTRARGDRTRGGTVVPGLGEAPAWLPREDE